MVTVTPLTPDRLDDVAVVFGADEPAAHCWCAWFLRPVREFHEVGAEGNRSLFSEMTTSESTPMGLLAYADDEPVGWAAVGPRDRYGRMLRSPTLRNRDRSEDATAWLVPCFVVHPDHRDAGVAGALLDGAIELARAHDVRVIEGFPLAGDKRRYKGADFMTGVEPLFASRGFRPADRPSSNRVIMRLEL